MALAMQLQLPLREVEVCKMRHAPHTPDTSYSPSMSSGDVSTPRNLWPATPTPTPRCTENISFMLPPPPVCEVAPCVVTRTRMNANAQAFIPLLAREVSEAETVDVDTKTFQGTVEVPNIGSVMHAAGECKPCAWFWKSRGCTNGVDCDYCHLCPSGALKERKKAKVAAIRSGAIAPKPSARSRMNTV